LGASENLSMTTTGASPVAVSRAFGDGFWSLITFSMQMAFVAIGGYVVATSRPAALQFSSRSDRCPGRILR
jgi:short subunit fatty acids transporter